MSAEHLVSALCARHGLPPEAGTPFLPLVRKALVSPDGARDRVLRLIDEALSQRADALGTGRPEERANGAVLLAVARVLHQWTPSEALLDLGSSLDRQGGDAA